MAWNIQDVASSLSEIEDVFTPHADDPDVEKIEAEKRGRLMAWMYMMGACYSCKRPFSFNPERVPSLTIKGTREPFCQPCIDAANPARVAKGLDPIVPAEGAYEPQEVP